MLDIFTPEQFRSLTEARWAETGGQKQMALSAIDRDVLQRCGVGDLRDVLHPSWMYRAFRSFFKDNLEVANVIGRLRYERFPPVDDALIESRLPPQPFYAAKFYVRPSFPDNAANRRVIEDAIRALAARAPVVLLETKLRIDDHAEFTPDVTDTRHPVTRILDGVPAGRNLAAQSAIISRASAFVGTYGGFSYLAPAYGVPSIALFSEPGHFLRAHLDLARRAATSLGSSITPIDARSRTTRAVVGLTPIASKDRA